jgi:hypothetical protein
LSKAILIEPLDIKMAGFLLFLRFDDLSSGGFLR